MEIMKIENPIDERLPWHKLEVERLMVVLDTSFVSGSATDFASGAQP
jgi:hypothetical protein